METPSRLRPLDTSSRSASERPRTVPATRISLGRLVRTPSADYFLLLGVTLFLVLFGLAMVLSSSSVDSYVSNGGFFGVLLHQGFIAIVGIPLMLIVSRAPLKFWQRIAWPALIVTCLVQCLVFTPLGVTVAGNTNWLSVGSFQFQPSEAIKVALVIWLGTILAQKQNLLSDWRHVLIPVFGVGGAAVLLVMIRGDLGTTVILGAILFGSLVFAGVRMRMLAIPLGVGAVGAVAAAAASTNRLTRVLAFFGTGCDSSSKTISAACWQPLHGTWAMADGGIFGVGLGNSKAKWSWLPAADNDYIYAIIGEELGLIGAIVVLLLFIVLAIAFLRIMSTTSHLQVRVTTAAVMVWVVGQALVNMGVVLGFVPVLGVPLPLISAGGTALLTTLIGIGVVLSFARNARRAPMSSAP
ncbi:MULTISPECIES: putative peptidoglycan glycosyltransferase FtsW [unclassified Cryobacterium]|uniref:peptidoglycan glycosyltransferase FtsW n=1 Tax=unclassified Cryobacterium TaxID=2649013 RepID=UPI002AB422C7|nr:MULTISPECIES: putative peptidoglycan glycosyltransferase FtsW [unclassified Cryobacterium]MDY7541752.1 putative peptidoglycan glycosyltransferase FtsW [Cryobacterium sp. 5B3]MEB0000190.1 putative peptidoglycan glycosyltransferase FtsW [Cryobacterium sp. RTS3]MEB0266662.1 putative peptidoglycan glycosyltransferase FtsW [Cryobacterium sp. 10I5]MEB0275863.1 putative peptidoglycan glycosyltransferase FtsW [Cryobacterium sp. 5B3]